MPARTPSTARKAAIKAGRKRIVRGLGKNRNAWEVLIRDHHESYIGWAEFERNQRLISDNANGKSLMSRGPIRRLTPWKRGVPRTQRRTPYRAGARASALRGLPSASAIRRGRSCQSSGRGRTGAALERALACGAGALEDELAGLAASAETPLTQLERERLLALGADVESA